MDVGFRLQNLLKEGCCRRGQRLDRGMKRGKRKQNKISPQYVSSVVVVGLGFRRFGDIGFRTPREEWLGFKTQYLIDG